MRTVLWNNDRSCMNDSHIIDRYIFSKVMRQVVKFWRSKGIRIVMYLDDGFGGGSNLQEAELVSEVVQSDLQRLGFLIAVEKCHWQPTQEVVWLGLVWNTKLDKVKVSDKRIEKLKQNLENILNAHERGCVWFEVRGIASVAGQLISTQTVFGKQTRLRTRYLFFFVFQIDQAGMHILDLLRKL